jgi:mono/diheme cytochrome c family protein
VKRSNIWTIVCGLGIVLPAYFAQQNPPSKGREVTKLYAENCASCHGADMSGGSASSLVDAAWRYGGDDVSITHSIRDVAIPMQACPRCGRH